MFIRSHPNYFKIVEFISKIRNETLRVTIDTKDDLKLIKVLYEKLGNLDKLQTEQIIEFFNKYPNYLKINENVKQNSYSLSDDAVNVAFITEGNFNVGMGHIYRSLTFAKELKAETGAKIVILSKSSMQTLNKINKDNFTILQFKNDDEIVDYLKKSTIKVVIIDRVDLEQSFLKKIRDSNTKLVIIDSLNKENDKYADIIINALDIDRILKIKSFTMIKLILTTSLDPNIYF